MKVIDKKTIMPIIIKGITGNVAKIKLQKIKF